MTHLPERSPRPRGPVAPSADQAAHEADAARTRCASRFSSVAGTIGIATFWLLLLGWLYLAVEQARKPGTVRVTADGALSIPRQRDGHFRVAGSVNGQPVKFLVDTGASLVSVTDALALKAGLDGGKRTAFRTANGMREGRVVRADSVTVHALTVANLRVGTGYTDDEAENALLGQNFLRQFDVEIKGDSLLLRPRQARE